MKKPVSIFFLSFILAVGFAQPIAVTVESTPTGFVLMRNGSPYFIKGAGGDAFPERLKEYGGNSIRTWGTDANTITLLDKAQQLGLTVTMGLWVGHQEHGFDYNNVAAVQAQLEGFRSLVKLYKNHPAVLAWGIGNEVELNVTASAFNKKAWNAINDIAAMIHQEDGNHPTLTITAGIDIDKAKDIIQRAPELDLLGVNAYGGIGGVANTLSTAGWQKPHIITEWGPNGPWEVNKTTWGAALEQTSTEKAALYKSRYESAILGNPGKCLGSYVFLWANKEEGTPTWFGLFMPTVAGEETEVVDVMNYEWSGAWPANRAPKIVSAVINLKSASQSPILINDVGNIATISVTDAENDPLTFEFLFRPETGTAGTTNTPPATISYLPNLITQQSSNSITFRAPANIQNYRLYIFVRDNHNNVATANIPFRVALEPLVSQDPLVIYPIMDAYVRGGVYADEKYGVSDNQRLLTRLDPNNASNSRETYLGFTIGSINKGIDKVLLKVFGGNAQETKTAVLGTRNDTWTENQINWANKPIPSVQEMVSLDTATIKSNVNSYYEWDVTNFVNQVRFDKANFVSFVLKNISASDNPTEWKSRETRPNPPTLAFTLNNGDIVLGIDDIEGIHIYPNPFSKFLSINSSLKNVIKQITVLSMKGDTLFIKDNVDTSSLELTIGNDLTQGLYLLQIQWKGGRISYHKLAKE
jgi:hypothetical protein